MVPRAQSEELQEPDPFPDWLEQQSSNKEILLLQVTIFQLVRNIDYRPFKALVVGSSPTQPTLQRGGLNALTAGCNAHALKSLGPT